MMKQTHVLVRIPSEEGCKECALNNKNDGSDACDIMGIDCQAGFVYKFKPETNDVPTEYNWIKERRDLLVQKQGVGSPTTPEIDKLNKWLEKHKSERWETCTKENTEKGNIIRHAFYKKIYKVKYINNSANLFILESAAGEDLNSFYVMDHYEINVLKNKEN